jgi:K+-transporting ATPase ATPase C chain
MLGHLRGNPALLILSLLVCCVIYPLIVLGIGKSVFPNQAEGSLIDEKGQLVTDTTKAVGSRLVAQPFAGEEFFQPRPSAVSYNGAASGATNWGANNYLLRDRVARQLGPIVKYRGGSQKGQLVAPDIEKWFQADRFQGGTGIVAQWAQAHSNLAANWIKGNKSNGEYVAAWQKAHPDVTAQWAKDNPDNPEPKPEDLAVPFFTEYSTAHPGTFPSAVAHKTPDGKTESVIEPVQQGADIQSLFFDMWRQDNPDADLEPVPADMVMASGSGLDPDITLKNALYQLDRVAGAWAKKTRGDAGKIHQQIEQLLDEKATAPLGGLAGVAMINVLETNLALRNRYESQVVPESPATESAAAGQPEPAAATAASTGSDAPARPEASDDAAGLRSQVGDVSNQIKQLLGRLDEYTAAVAQEKAVHDKTMAELSGLEDRLAKLTANSGDVAQLIERVGSIEARVTSATERLQAIQTDVKQTRDALKQVTATNRPKP